MNAITPINCPCGRPRARNRTKCPSCLRSNAASQQRRRTRNGPRYPYRLTAKYRAMKTKFTATRTLGGMRTHQRVVHVITQQQKFQFSDILSTKE